MLEKGFEVIASVLIVMAMTWSTGSNFLRYFRGEYDCARNLRTGIRFCDKFHYI